MNYNISINQKAISELNKTLVDKLDLKDATILDWMLKFHAEPKAKTKQINGSNYIWVSYAYIIAENPLLEIVNKQTMSRRIEKLITAGLLDRSIDLDEGNKTYFGLTQVAFDLFLRGEITLSTEKSIPIDSKVDTLSTQKSNNYNINDYKYTTTKEKLKANDILIDTLNVKYGKSTDINKKIDEFVAFLESTGQKHHSDSDLFKHFTYWLPSNLKTIRNMDKELEFFLKMFNTLSKTNFKATDGLKVLLQKQIDNGFTAVDMEKAIKNMRSSNDKNKWHKDTHFQFATPEHLLKDGNLNKYLNVKY